MIYRIKLKFGSSIHQEPLDIQLTPVTVFVGPNNSGKSKILNEIHAGCIDLNSMNKSKIISSITFKTIFDPKKEIEKFKLKTKPDVILGDGVVLYGKNSNKHQVRESDLLKALSQSNNNQSFLTYYVAFNTQILNGTTRINLVAPQTTGDLTDNPLNHLGVLFRDDKKRQQVRKIIYDAFRKYFVVDPTQLGTFKIKLSTTEPLNDSFERSLDEVAIKFFENSEDIQLASDGVKAYTGIILSIVAGDPHNILIDEPEAFLHPSLAFKLGKEISHTANESFKSLFVSTHSSNFLMGCIQSGAPLNIIRLTYSNELPTARLLPSDKVLKLMRNPLLRSTGVLNGLFYEYIIVTEADSDRAFYQEINERLLAFAPNKGIPNCLFLNAQNKQTIHEIMKPLREMGIPCAAIVDVDIVKEGGKNWTNLLNSAFMPEVTIKATATSRSYIKGKFDDRDLDFKLKGGVEVLNSEDQEACNNLFDQLDCYGIFAVRKGELESWLQSLNVTATHSPQWLIETFEKLGEDPMSKNYVNPFEGDVWEFMANIKSWFENPSRKGIPD